MAAGTFWSLSGAVLSRGLVLLSSLIIARLLGKAGYGRWGLVLSTVTLFAQFAIFGVALTVTKHVAELRKTDPSRAGRILSFSLIVGLISVATMALTCLGAGRWLARDLYKVPELAGPLMLASVMLFGMVSVVVMRAALAGFEDFRRIAWINAVQGMVLFAAAAPLTWRWGIHGAVGAMAVSQFTALILFGQATLQKCRDHHMPLGTSGIWQERAVLWKYAIPSLLGGGISAPAAALSKALVARSGDLVGLGGFEAAARWQAVVMFVPEAARQITLPLLAKLKGQNDRRRYIKALWANIALNAGIATVMAVPIMILSPWILGLYGKGFREDWDILVILVGSGVLQAVKDVFARVTASLEKLWWNVGISVLWGGVLLGGTYLLLPHYGVRGYAWAVAASRLVAMIMYGIATLVIIKGWTALQEDGP